MQIDDPARDASNDFFRGLQVAPGCFDEVRAPDGSLRLVWKGISAYLAGMGRDELIRREHAALRQVLENGATYNVHAEQEGGDHPWELDILPVLISEHEWNGISDSLVQRALLLNAILVDLYGPQRLIRDGLIPPELLFDNPAYLLPCRGLPVPEEIHLHSAGFDIGRMPDGSWVVLGDLTQTPAGAGYVLENRIVLSRLLADHFRDSQVQRLALFFQKYRETLYRLAPRHRDNPRIVALSGGPSDPAYFEHAFLARYLGHTLVEGEDLAVREQAAWMKMLGGLQPVDVIVRRMDDDACDPLELTPSGAGLPGLLQAVRSGQVIVANALGSGLLENPAFLPFLPRLCEHILGEPLRMASVPTWWCGDAVSREHVIDHLDELHVFPAFGAKHGPVEVLSGLAKGEVAKRIAEAPHRYVAQARATLSCVPAIEKDALVSRHLFVRTYLAASDRSYAVMPGGLARAIDRPEAFAASLASGGVSKDVWVVSEEPVSEFSLLSPAGATVELSRGGGDLPSRVADNLFWLGRYVERADYMIRIARVLLVKLSERPEGAEIPHIGSYLAALGLPTPALVEEAEYAAVERDLLRFLFEESFLGGLRQTVDSIRRVAGIARDRLSADTWRMLNRLELTLEDMSVAGRVSIGEVVDLLDRFIVRFAAFCGISMESMTRGHGWRFLDMGRRLERSLQTIALLENTLITVAPNEAQILDDVLGMADSSITYRRRYLTTLQAAPVLDLLLADETNPRSLIFQLEALAEHVRLLPRDEEQVGLSEDQRIITRVVTMLRLIEVTRIALEVQDGRRVLLAELFTKLHHDIPEFSDVITRRFLSHARPSRQLETARMTAHALPRPPSDDLRLQ